MEEKENFFSKQINKHRIIKALVRKEFYQIIRDPSTILIAFVFPLMLLFIYGVGVSLDMNHLKIGVVIEDTSPQAQDLLYSMCNSKFFYVEAALNKSDLENKLISGRIRGFVTIPFYFSEFMKRPNNIAPIYAVADGSETNTANFVQNYVGGAWMKWLVQETIRAGGDSSTSIINVQDHFRYNENLDSRHFLLPGSIAIIMTLIGTLLTALVIAREWERGTIEALMATPITMEDIYTSKIIAYFLLGIVSMIFCSIISVFLFGVPFRGSVLLLVAVSSIFLLTALGGGLLISSFTRNQFFASQIAIITAFLPGFMLSGFIFEISSMPFIIRCLSYLIPARYMVSCLQALFLAGNLWQLLLVNSCIMLLIVFILFTIIFLNTRKRLD